MMSSLVIALIVFACVFICAIAGVIISAMLPEHHLSENSKDVVKLSMGLIATMAALVLGLLTSSAKSTYDQASSEIQQGAVNVIMLDRALARYGPETQQIREQFRQAIVARLRATWPEVDLRPMKIEASERLQGADDVEVAIGKLSPQTDTQREIRARAQQTAHDLLAIRWLLFAQASNPLPTPFLVVMIFWLCILFGSFGLLAPRNATVMAAIMLCAVAVAGSTFLILEMSHPFVGLIKVSGEPLRYALSQLGP